MRSRTGTDSPGVFDLECEAWDRFVIGATLRGGVSRVYRDPEAMFRALLAGGTWYAHNAGRYDALWFLALCARHRVPAEIAVTGPRVLRVQAGRCRILDSYALAPMSLRAFAPIGGEAKAETGLPCSCGKSCGGYCSIRRGMPAALRSRLVEYLVQDCCALDAALATIREYAADNRIQIRDTIGATAWRTAREWCGLPDARWRKGDYALARDGYYGGRVEVFRPNAARGWRYDIHSSYPAALERTPIPIGACRSLEGPAARRSYLAGDPGVYAADVDVPAGEWIPPLPVRMRDRIVFPIGPCGGTWTGTELRYAESCGVKVRCVRYGVAWESADTIVAPYCREIWRLRDEAARSGRRELAGWIKLLANSLTGKFSQRPEFSRAKLSADDPGGSWQLAHPHGDVWYQTVHRTHACGHVQWAAYLTAEARIELHRQLTHAGDAAVYCDTDSVYATRRLGRRIGDALGEWGCEGDFRRFRALAPKLYRYRTAGRDVVRGKGLPGLTAEGFDGLGRGGSWSDERGVLSFRQGVRRTGSPLFSRRLLVRSLDDPDPVWFGGRRLQPDGTTRPVPIRELSGR